MNCAKCVLPIGFQILIHSSISFKYGFILQNEQEKPESNSKLKAECMWKGSVNYQILFFVTFFSFSCIFLFYYLTNSFLAYWIAIAHCAS